MQVYLDNAATTSLNKEVFEEMSPYFLTHFGNPSSLHKLGRTAKSAVEGVRKKMAQILGVDSKHLFFTSGATESTNLIFHHYIFGLGVTKVLLSPLEHHAVLNPLLRYEEEGKIEIEYIRHLNNGVVNLSSVDDFLDQNKNALVVLMHANNEIGNINDIQQIGSKCKEAGCYFHSDTVQTVAHGLLTSDQSAQLTSFVGSAHKFHGPKGVGFLVFQHDSVISPLLLGGAQEKNVRAGTENVAAIVGMGKAMGLTYQQAGPNHENLQALKAHLVGLLEEIPNLEFNGMSTDIEFSLPAIVNVSVRPDNPQMLLFKLDMLGVFASGGSACSSGALKGSHVIEYLGGSKDQAAIRFSMSPDNTTEELDYAVEVLKKVLG